MTAHGCRSSTPMQSSIKPPRFGSRPRKSPRSRLPRSPHRRRPPIYPGGSSCAGSPTSTPTPESQPWSTPGQGHRRDDPWQTRLRTRQDRVLGPAPDTAPAACVALGRRLDHSLHRTVRTTATYCDELTTPPHKARRKPVEPHRQRGRSISYGQLQNQPLKRHAHASPSSSGDRGVAPSVLYGRADLTGIGAVAGSGPGVGSGRGKSLGPA
jgi:hypothetical protein